ncbi:heavy-metal-associated domain-containing protein [Winogradskyella luteola]|uniref:Heavy-metal-associated domain-containing protein n=1 Tax=Winogradskyella luteola TaxID=2828330 RepID=A0A9X1F6T4_9FLAO|nr:heavy metal-associated domain-containing protein [Winogradskyella luteola]MBV7268426.1 heavy-metal-associated domain-containing protein [Winogradskyella luteola]
MISTVKIQNLKCHGCANTIVTQLSKLDGVENVSVDNETDEVSFSHNSETIFETAKKKLSDLGYPMEGETNSLPKKAKSFVSCAVGRMSK